MPYRERHKRIPVGSFSSAVHARIYIHIRLSSDSTYLAWAAVVEIYRGEKNPGSETLFFYTHCSFYASSYPRPAFSRRDISKLWHKRRSIRREKKKKTTSLVQCLGNWSSNNLDDGRSGYQLEWCLRARRVYAFNEKITLFSRVAMTRAESELPRIGEVWRELIGTRVIISFYAYTCREIIFRWQLGHAAMVARMHHSFVEGWTWLIWEFFYLIWLIEFPREIDEHYRWSKICIFDEAKRG